MSSPKVWFITGASSGFGRSMTESVLKKGDIAVATLRRPEALADLAAKYPTSRLLVLKLDVTNKADVTAAFAQVEKTFGRLDVVFNNAGYGMLAEAEGASEDVARTMFDVNFWGAVRVSNEAVRFFREVNKPGVGGRLLQISSVVGVGGAAGIAHYSATKFALEGYTESLALELDPEWNIKVTLIEPGGFRTKGISHSLVHTPVHPAYTKATLSTAIIRQFLANAELPGDADKAVEVFYRLAALPDPPLHFPIGKDSIEASKKKTASFLVDVEKYESWSEGLNVDQAR